MRSIPRFRSSGSTTSVNGWIQGVRPSRDWKATLQRSAGKLESHGELPGRRVALRAVAIAVRRADRRTAIGRRQAVAPRVIGRPDLALRQAVEAHQHVLRALGRRPRDRCERIEKPLVRIERGNDGECGRGGPAPCPGVDRVEGRARRGRRVLGVERHDDDPIDAVLRERIEPRGNRGVPVAHRQAHLSTACWPELLRERGAQIEAVEEERRAAVGPDGPVLERRPPRAERKDRTVDEEGARDDVRVDHARVHEELREVAPHGGDLGGVGRPEVHEEHAGPTVFAHGLLA